MNSNQLWDRYEAVLKKHNPLGNANLQAPATEIEIKEAEQAMKVRFPKELKDAYRRHNGVKEARWSGKPVLFATSEASWGNLKSVVIEWEINVQVDNTVSSNHLNNYTPEYLQSVDIHLYCWHPSGFRLG